MFRLNSNIYICNTSGKLLFLFHRVDADTQLINEERCIVFYSTLLAVFKMFCFVCKSPNPSVEMATNGTIFTVTQNWRSCGPMKKFKWMSRPLVTGRHTAGNLLLSFGTITSGVNISQMLLLFKHMGLCTIWFIHKQKGQRSPIDTMTVNLLKTTFNTAAWVNARKSSCSIIHLSRSMLPSKISFP